MGQLASRQHSKQSPTPHVRCLHNSLVNVRVTGEVPREWKYAIIEILYLDKDQTDCNTYRAISLVSHAGRVLLKIVASRVTNYCGTEGICPEEQCGFRLARSAVDMLLVVRQLLGI